MTYPPVTPSRALYVAEPPASYRVLPPLVVDCSMIATLLYQEDQCEEAERRLTDRELHAPDLLDYEFANVAMNKIRRQQSGSVAAALAFYIEYPITLHPIDVTDTVELAARYNLSAYDAAYLWLAEALKAPLATFDAKLGEAARVHLASLI
jgi:predicted nucleic acid-binding protein